MATTSISQGAYAGKFIERFPEIRSAGVVSDLSGERAATTVSKPYQPPRTPDKVRRYDATYNPKPGDRTIHYGKFFDPELKIAENMRHGGKLQSTGATAQSLLNPPLRSNFEERFLEHQESIYKSHKTGPLGRQPAPVAPFPPHIDVRTHTFGMMQEKGDRAGPIVNPRRTWPEIENEEVNEHPLYRKSHQEFWPGEQVHYNYRTKEEGGGFDLNKMYGKPTPMDQRGTAVKSALHWSQLARAELFTPIASKRVDDFKERTENQLGQTLDPNKPEREAKVGPDYAFGIKFHPDLCTVSDLLHNRAPIHAVRALPSADVGGRDPVEREKALLATARARLHKENWQKFPELLATLAQMDKESTGSVSVDEFREAVRLLSVPLDVEMVEQFRELYDVDCGGRVPYRAVIDAINWMLYAPGKYRPSVIGSDVVSTRSRPQTPDRVQPRVENAISTVCLERANITSSTVNGVLGGPIPMPGYRRLGVPSIRDDIAAPKVKRTADRQNYGDEGNAGAMLNPNRLNNFKIYEKDFILPRDRCEVRRILESCGILLQDDEFESVWQLSVELYREWASLPALGAQGRAASAPTATCTSSSLSGATSSTQERFCSASVAVTNLHSVRAALSEFDRAAAALCVEQQVRDGTGGAREALEMLGLSAAAKTASTNASTRFAS